MEPALSCLLLSVLACLGTSSPLFQSHNVSKGSHAVTVQGCGRSIYTYADTPDRIVGGRNAEPGEYPWQVSIRERGFMGFEHICGGSILNEYWILTATHCFDSTSTGDYDIVVGLHRLSRMNSGPAKIHKLSRIILHEHYEGRQFVNDIALLKTVDPINIKGSGGYINGVCLPRRGSDPVGFATVSGWGHTTEGGELSDVLKSVEVPLINRDVCNSRYDEDPYDEFDAVLDSMICAGAQGRDSCQADSGGPLIQRNQNIATLIGVVSNGAGCGLKYYPGIYTRVASFIDWIERRASL